MWGGAILLLPRGSDGPDRIDQILLLTRTTSDSSLGNIWLEVDRAVAKGGLGGSKCPRNFEFQKRDKKKCRQSIFYNTTYLSTSWPNKCEVRENFNNKWEVCLFYHSEFLLCRFYLFMKNPFVESGYLSRPLIPFITHSVLAEGPKMWGPLR